MLIHSSHQPRTSPLKTRTTLDSPTTLAQKDSWRKSETFEQITYGAAQVGGVALGVGAGIGASQLMTSSLNGVGGALTGLITGAVTGGIAGFAVAEGTKRALDLDRYGDSMMKLVSLSVGVVGGAVSGGVSGYFGAQPMVVAPVAVAGGLVGSMALHAAQRAITRN